MSIISGITTTRTYVPTEELSPIPVERTKPAISTLPSPPLEGSCLWQQQGMARGHP